MKKFSQICAFAQKLFKSEDYKEYDLEVEGSWLLGLRYYLTVYSNDKKFRFLLDSGCVNSVIPYRFLKHFTHVYMCGSKSQSVSGHIAQERTYLVTFGLEPEYSEQNTFVDYVGAPSRKACPIFDDKCSGLLGATFLSYCEVDLRHAKIRVFRNREKVIELAPDPLADAFIEQLANS